MRAIERNAVFDEEGNIIIDKLPSLKNKQVKLLILIDEENEELYNLSATGLSNAYSEDEPEYNLSMLKEPNPEYKK